MKIILCFTFLIVTNLYALDCGVESPAWNKCTSDQDCVAGRETCGRTAYNKKFLKTAEENAACKATVLECAIRSDLPSPNEKVKCVQSICKLMK